MDGKMSTQKALAREQFAAVRTGVLVGGGCQVMLQCLWCGVFVTALGALKVAAHPTHIFITQ